MTSLVALQGGEIGYKAQTGIAVRTAFSTPERAGDDFKASVQVAFGDAQVFSGDLRALGAFGPGRGTVTFAHTVVGAIELLYLHLLEMSLRGNH